MAILFMSIFGSIIGGLCVWMIKHYSSSSGGEYSYEPHKNEFGETELVSSDKDDQSK